MNNREEVDSQMITTDWLQTANHVIEVDCVKTGEAAKDKLWSLHRLAKDCSSYYLTIFTDASATNCTAMGRGCSVLATGVFLQFTILIPHRPAHGARPFKLK